MKIRIVVILVGLAFLQSALIFMAAYKMNQMDLIPRIILRFTLLSSIIVVISKSITLTSIHRSHKGSQLFRFLNYLSLIAAFIFIPANGMVISLLYFYMSDWPINSASQHTNWSIGHALMQMTLFLIVPLATLLIAKQSWGKKK